MTVDRFRVVPVDDHPLFLTGMRGALDATDDLVVAGTAIDAAGAIALVRETRPDVVLLDHPRPSAPRRFPN